MCYTIFYKLYNVNQKIGKHGSTVKIIEVMTSRKSSWKRENGNAACCGSQRTRILQKKEGSSVNCNGAAKKNEDREKATVSIIV